MFDSLQTGIVVVQGYRTIDFMNDICNKILSKVTNLKDFHKNLDEHNKRGKVDPIGRKIFHLFEIQDKKSKSKRRTSSENTGTDASTLKTSFSILEISRLETKDLAEKIFTFDKKVGKDLSKTSQNIDIDSVIKGL